MKVRFEIPMTESAHIRLTRSQRQVLDQAARQRGLRVSEFIREMAMRAASDMPQAV